MLPTRRFAAVAFVVAIVATIAAYVPTLKPGLFAVDGGLVLVALLDVVFALGSRIEVEREFGEIFSVGRANIVTLKIRNRGGRSLRGVIADDPLEHVTTEGNPSSFRVGSRATTILRYAVTPTRRGRRSFRAIHVRYPSLFGLMARQEFHPLPANVDVYPDVHAARALEMLRRQGRQDARVGSLRVRGGDTEFERLRPYQRGDEVRHVDWRASARRDDLVVRQFQAESNQNVIFALDIGRSMRGESQGLTSIDHALNAALLTADVALRGGDKAGLIVFDDAPRRFIPPSGGRAGGRKLTRAVYDLEAGFAASDYRTAATFLRSQVKARSLFVILTNLLEQRSAKELASSVRALMPRHLPLCVLMRDTEIEDLVVAPTHSVEDVYIRAAAAENLAWRDGLIRELRDLGALVLDAKPNEVTPNLVKSYLEVKARRLL